MSFGFGLDSICEPHSVDDFRQLMVAVEAPPAFLGGLGELEDHGARDLVREASLRADRAMPHGGEGALDDVGR